MTPTEKLKEARRHLTRAELLLTAPSPARSAVVAALAALQQEIGKEAAE
jgi:hypothetical protein